MAAYYPNQRPAASSSSSSSSSDPYAPFYYWEPTTNSWAFDYNGYYAAYGHPSQQPHGHTATAPASSYPDSAASSTTYSQPHPQPTSASSFSSAFHRTPSATPTPVRTAFGTGSGVGGVGPVDLSASSTSTSTGPMRTLKRAAMPAAGPKDAQGNPLSGTLKRGEKRVTVVKSGPEGAYEDPTLLEWDPTHKRLFVGDLGNDVNDAMLARSFQKWPSFSKAKVVRRKHDEKSRGYGFVSFSDPEDFLKAWKEMEGKYIGSRPCRLKAAQSTIEAKEIGYRQDKILANNVKHQEWKMKHKMGGAIGGQLRRHGVGKAWGSK